MEVLKSKIEVAIQKGDFAKIQTLASKSNYNFADAQFDNSELLCSALKYEHPDIAKWLIEQGCPVNSESCEEPLFVAIQKFYNDLVRLLLERGARPHVLYFNSFYSKSNALHIAVKTRNIEAVELILASAEPNIVYITNISNYTALQLAVRENCIPICQQLLKFYSNLTANNDNDDLCTKDKCAALKIAIIERVNPRIIEALLNAGANVNEMVLSIDDFGKKYCTLLDYALSRVSHQKYYCSILKILLIHNANLGVYTDLFKFKQLDIRQLEFSEYIALLTSMKSFINPCFLEILSQFRYFRRRQNSCLSEIEKMKETKIIYGVSYYDLLIKPVKNLAIYGRNKNFIENFKSKLDTLEEEFPIYSNKLTDQFNMAKYRACLCKLSHSIFNKLLPYIVCEMIFAYLDTEDLKNISHIKFSFSDKVPLNLLPPVTRSYFM